MNRIKEYRKKRGLTQKELGKMIGVTDASIGNYELGNQNPRSAVVPLLCKALMTTEEKLFPKEEEKEEITQAQKAVVDGMLSCGNATYFHETIAGRDYIIFRVRVN